MILTDTRTKHQLHWAQGKRTAVVVLVAKIMMLVVSARVVVLVAKMMMLVVSARVEVMVVVVAARTYAHTHTHCRKEAGGVKMAVLQCTRERG
jgi:hypothetical protein